MEDVYLIEEIEKSKGKLNDYNLPLILGRDLDNTLITKDITEIGSFLISGATGSGKSVFLHSVICTLLKTKTPQEVGLLLIDPKMGIEMMMYENISHLIYPVITNPEESYGILTKVVKEREKNREVPKHIVVLIDEFADLMLCGIGKDIEKMLCKIATEGKELGIYMFLSTSKASDTVFTEELRKYIQNRISFALPNKEDSSIVIGEEGGETLLGNGGMIYKDMVSGESMRIQSPYISTEEEELIVKSIPKKNDYDIKREEAMKIVDALYEDILEPLYKKAEALVINSKVTTNTLQRSLGIDYITAKRLLELLEEKGVVGKR